MFTVTGFADVSVPVMLSKAYRDMLTLPVVDAGSIPIV